MAIVGCRYLFDYALEQCPKAPQEVLGILRAGASRVQLVQLGSRSVGFCGSVDVGVEYVKDLGVELGAAPGGQRVQINNLAAAGHPDG